MDRARTGEILLWLAVACGAAFGITALTIGLTASLPFLILFGGFLAGGEFLRKGIMRFAEGLTNYGLSMLVMAGVLKIIFSQFPIQAVVAGVMGTATFIAGLVLGRLALRSGQTSRYFMFNNEPMTRPDRIGSLCFLVLLVFGLVLAGSGAARTGWDVWLIITAVGQAVALLLLGWRLIAEARRATFLTKRR